MESTDRRNGSNEDLLESLTKRRWDAPRAWPAYEGTPDPELDHVL
jgi:hypothetical protein